MQKYSTFSKYIWKGDDRMYLHETFSDTVGFEVLRYQDVDEFRRWICWKKYVLLSFAGTFWQTLMESMKLRIEPEELELLTQIFLWCPGK